MSNAYYKQGLIGGADTDIDSVNGSILSQDDVGMVLADNVVYFYKLEAASGATESSPSVISPDSNAGTKRWILQSANSRIITTSVTDPTINAAVTTEIVDTYGGVVITLTTTGNSQTIENPSTISSNKEFIVANNDTSSDSITVNGVVIGVGEAQKYFWDLTSWITLEAVSASQISFTPSGDIVSTDVQSAITELDTEKVSKAGDVMTGELSAGITEIVKPATDTLTAQECRGTSINNYGQTVENTQTLPTAIVGLNGIVEIGTSGAGDFHLKSGPTDKIYLDGTSLDDGDKVTLSSPALGNFFSYKTFKTGATSYDWIVRTGEGSLIDGGV